MNGVSLLDAQEQFCLLLRLARDLVALDAIKITAVQEPEGWFYLWGRGRKQRVPVGAKRAFTRSRNG